MKKILSVIICIGLTLVLFAGCGESKKEETTAKKSTTESTSATPKDTTLHHAEIVVKDYGTIKVELDPSQAPITVENFINLAKSGFYDGLTFHRIMSGFMIQGGDPKGNGTGGSDKKIKGEFSRNGVKNTILTKEEQSQWLAQMLPTAARHSSLLYMRTQPSLTDSMRASVM